MRPRTLVSPADRALTESESTTWARWSEDRERRDLQRQARATVASKQAANEPLYPRECAERIASETCHIAPDWRHIRPTLGAPWGRLLKAQPELSPKITAQREATITAVFNGAPRHLQEAVKDLRVLIDLLLMAHEAAAYQVGFEAGRMDERQHASTRRREAGA